MNNLDIKATPVFYANLKAYKSGYPIIVNEGGSRSSKSYSLMQLMIAIAYDESGKRISIVSHSLPHIKRGVYRDFRTIMRELDLWDDNQWRATDFVYYFDNGSYIELIGLDDETRARGPGRDILWLNEANLIKHSIYQQLAMRTTGTTFADLNPADFNCYWYTIADDTKNKKIHSTYRQNLPNLTQQQIDILEGYKDLGDPFMYNVYCLGQRGASEEIIYRGWELVDDLPGKGEVIYGLDFGYTNPSAFVAVEIYDGAIYAKELFYERGLTKPELNDRIAAFNVGQKYIYADAAEPDSIEELRRMGLNIHSSNKDVWNGIITVKSRRLFITRDSQNLIFELRNYKWKKTKNDEILEEPIKEYDHMCFIGSTIIETSLGKKRIKDIKSGDYVLTSEGYKKVNRKLNNGRKQVKNYLMHFDTFSVNLVATKDHLIKTTEGWKEISKLQQGQTVFLHNTLTANLSNYNREKDTLIMGQKKCIGTSGNITTVKDQKVTMCIIRMKIAGITARKTLNLSKEKTIYQSTSKKDLLKIKNGLRNFSRPELLRLRNGIKAKRVKIGIKNMPLNTNLENLTQLKEIANYAENPTWQKHITQNSVIQTAKLKRLDKGIKKVRKVYDLSIDDKHEYFANGVLVHNCDALRYAVHTYFSKPQPVIIGW